MALALKLSAESAEPGSRTSLGTLAGGGMNGLTLPVGESTLAGFLLALARTAGFVLVTPPFNTRSVPGQVRTGVAIALALPLAGFMQASAPALTSSALLLRMVLQVVTGLALGFFVMVAVSTLQAVGDLIDLAGGFNLSVALDPLMLLQTSVMGRLHQLVAVTLLFVTDGHLMVLHGLARSVQTLPDASLSWDVVGHSATSEVAGLFTSAVEVAGPVIAAMLVADVTLGLVTRAAPALNAFALAFPLKILFTLLLAGLMVARLPGALATLVEHAVLHDLDLTSSGVGPGGVRGG